MTIERLTASADDFRVRLSPQHLEASTVRRAAREWMNGQGFPVATVNDAELVISELLANAVQSSPEDHSIDVHVTPGKRGLIIEVADDGSGFSSDGSPTSDPLRERGRGLQIVRAVSDEFHVRYSGGRTIVSARLPQTG